MRDGERQYYARRNRQRMPDGERILWWYLRGGRMGAAFRRQHVVGSHILDFAALSIKLNIEIDGQQHIESSRDGRRDGHLVQRGWTVLRFTNYDMAHELEGVLRVVEETIEDLKAGQRKPGIWVSRKWGD